MLSKKQPFRKFILLAFVGIIFYPGNYKEGTASTEKRDQELINYLQVAQKNRSQGNYEQAIVYFEKAISLIKKTNLKEEVLEAIEGKGIVLWNLGQMREAANCFKEGLLLAREWKLPLLESFFEACLEVHRAYQEGKDKREKMDYKGAMASFERALYLARKLCCPELELKCLRQASSVYLDQNEIEKFRILNEKGLRIARLLNHTLEEGRFLNNLGLYYLMKSDLIASLAILNKASLLIEVKGSKQDLADCLFNLGLVISEIGLYDRAIKYFKKAMEIDKEIGPVDVYILDLNNIGLCLLNKGKVNNDLSAVRDSLYYFKEALRLSEENRIIKRKIMVLNNLGNALCVLGEKDKAKDCLNEALTLSNEMNDKYFLTVVNDSLGNFYSSSDPNLSLKYLFKSKDYASYLKFYPDHWIIYYNIGYCYEKLNHYELAAEYYNKSIKLIDDSRRQINYDFYQVGFLRDKQVVFDALIRLKKKMSDQNNSFSFKEELFYTVEKTKAKTFLYIINNRDADEKSNYGDTRIEKKYGEGIGKKMSYVWSELNNAILGDKSQFDIVRKEDLYLTLLIEEKNKIINSNRESEPIANLKDIQENLLDEKTAILEYYLSEWGSLGIVISKRDFEIINLPAKKKIEDSILGYTKLISKPPLKEFDLELAAKRIYKEIFEPLEKRFPSETENLIVIPDGFLYYLPFESIIKENENKSFYLVEKYNIVYAPSISSLIVLKKRHKEFERETKDILIIGYPEYKLFLKNKKKQTGMNSVGISGKIIYQDELPLSPLPCTKKEIRAIRSMFPSEKRDIYMGKCASEDVVKSLPLNIYKIIHFACHGYVDESFPLRSGLILTPNQEKGQDGIFQAYEISNLKLKASLVVLSACQLARGPLEKAEGIWSLNRVFFTCGAKAVISSLWPINDRSSAELMRYFYHYLRKGRSIAEALRAAKREMLNSRFKYPFYWAGFILNGEGFSVLF